MSNEASPAWPPALSPVGGPGLVPPPRWAPLTGGTAVWVFMSAEVATFGAAALLS